MSNTYNISYYNNDKLINIDLDEDTILANWDALSNSMNEKERKKFTTEFANKYMEKKNEINQY